MAYICELGAGCYTAVDAPVVSRHKSWDLAVRKALTSDRLVAVDTESGRRLQIPSQGDRKLGAGRYGNGINMTKARALGLV